MEEKTLHQLIVEEWIDAYGHPIDRREFDAYSVSGFISKALEDYCITIEKKVDQ